MPMPKEPVASRRARTGAIAHAHERADRDDAASPLLRVAAFTAGHDVPAARFRIRQYIPSLAAHGIAIHEWPARFGAYPPTRRAARPAWAVANLLSRAGDIVRARPADVTFLQREFLSTFVTLERLTPSPRVLDVDDAIWVYGGDRFARRLAALCELVVCGSRFLAERFRCYHERVEVLPTVVDTDRFRPADPPPPPDTSPIVGWSGSRSTLPFLEAIEEPLAAVLQRVPSAVLQVVCDAAPTLRRLPGDRVRFIPWSSDGEVEAIQTMSVGLMPLDDSVVSQGKCSLKMLLYMACGIPAIVSPVGSNLDVLAAGAGSLSAASRDEWIEILTALLRDPQRRRELGLKGRELVAERYSVRACAPRLASLLRLAAGEGMPPR